MTDSGALRQKRYKHHRQGDHFYCKHDLQIGNAVADSVPAADELDAAAELRVLARTLARAYQGDAGNAALAKELRVTLLAILGDRPAPDTDREIAELFEALG